MKGMKMIKVASSQLLKTFFKIVLGGWMAFQGNSVYFLQKSSFERLEKIERRCKSGFVLRHLHSLSAIQNFHNRPGNELLKSNNVETFFMPPPLHSIGYALDCLEC